MLPKQASCSLPLSPVLPTQLQVVYLQGVPTLLTLGCVSAAIPCPTATLYYNVPALPTDKTAQFNIALGGVDAPSAGTFVLANSTVLYTGADLSAGGGLYKFQYSITTSLTGGQTGQWGPVNFGSGASSSALKQVPGWPGVHGMMGRTENGVYILYITTSSGQGSLNNALMRYDTSQYYSISAGWTQIVSAPANQAFLGVFSAPVALTVPNVNALNVFLNEHSGPFTLVGQFTYTDRATTPRPPTAFIWTITSDTSNGMFFINRSGYLFVANNSLVTDPGGGFNYYTGPATYTVGIQLADTANSYHTGYAFASAVITIVEIDDAPVLTPSLQIVQFFENFATNAPLLGTAATPNITSVDENVCPSSPFCAPTTYAAVPASLAVAACGIPLPGTRNATVSGTTSGPLLFAVNASTGVVTLTNYTALYGNSWATIHNLFQSTIVRAAFALCVNISDKPAGKAGAWSASYVYPVVVPDPSAGFLPANVTAIFNASALPLDGGNGGCTGVAKNPTVVTLRGTGFGAPNTALQSQTTITYGPKGVEFPCAVLRNNTNTTLQCTASAGYGSNLPLTLTINGQVATTMPGVAMSYAQPSVSSISIAGNSSGLASLSTTGGQVSY